MKIEVCGDVLVLQALQFITTHNIAVGGGENPPSRVKGRGSLECQCQVI